MRRPPHGYLWNRCRACFAYLSNTGQKSCPSAQTLKFVVNHRVPLLEQDQGLGNVLELLLGDEGFEVISCASLSDMLAHAASAPESVAIVDTEASALGRAADHERAGLRSLGKLLPLVLLTDFSVTRANCADDFEAFALLPKPFDICVVLRAVATGLQNRVASPGEPVRERNA
jgi:DNA-binding NtrC family response regulator